MDDQQEKDDRRQDGRPPRVAPSERTTDHDEDGQGHEVAVGPMQARELVRVLERGVDVPRVVVGLKDREDGCSHEIELCEVLDHQHDTSHGIGLSEYVHEPSSSSPAATSTYCRTSARESMKGNPWAAGPIAIR